MHLTGRYQPWYEGMRVEDSGHVYWCLGVDLDQTAKVQQKELFGTSDCRVKSELGMGAIPRDAIEFVEGWTPDGKRLKECRIKHVDGGTNTLMFYGSNNEHALTGQTVKGVWMDEEPEHHSDEIYSQCKTRTMTTQGFVMITMTPEHGPTPLNDMFDNKSDKDGSRLYLQQAEWMEAHVSRGGHLTNDDMAEMAAGIPDWQLEMRSKGIPVLGKGAVFKMPDDAICVDNVKVEDHHMVCAGVDFGVVVDPSVVVKASFNPDTEMYYLFAETYLDSDRSPKAIAKSILEGDYPNINVIVPHDGGDGAASEDHETKASLLRDYGVNVYGTFRNPLDTKLGMMNIAVDSTSVRSIAAGITTMNSLFAEGKLKVDSSLMHFLTEKHKYFFKARLGGGYDYAGEDHVIDAARYALMSLIDGKGTTAIEARGGLKPINQLSDIRIY